MTNPTLKHTPGPWDAFYKSKYDEWHVSVPMSTGNMKWALFDDGIRSENPEADARLIAAAPDLLAACQRVLSHPAFAACDCGEPGCATRQLREAVQKATEATA